MHVFIIKRDIFIINIAGQNNKDPFSMDFQNDPTVCGQKNDYGNSCFAKIVQDGWKMDY